MGGEIIRYLYIKYRSMFTPAMQTGLMRFRHYTYFLRFRSTYLILIRTQVSRNKQLQRKNNT